MITGREKLGNLPSFKFPLLINVTHLVFIISSGGGDDPHPPEDDDYFSIFMGMIRTLGSSLLCRATGEVPPDHLMEIIPSLPPR